ncbi:hypothetical protein [Phenylobacterium sp.]|uniref:hypothetical protein n=1 Tax=Phenylobacterium sp. TaxID=1871053 RepID=UPI003983C689
MKQLAKFTITVREEDFALSLVDDNGETTEYAAAPEVLDEIIDALDELLSEEDDDLVALEGDGDSYQKPLG